MSENRPEIVLLIILIIVVAVLCFGCSANAGPKTFGTPSTEKLNRRDALQYIEDSGGEFPTPAELKKTKKISTYTYWADTNCLIGEGVICFNGAATNGAPQYSWRLHSNQMHYAD